jgi:hypothetical protein
MVTINKDQELYVIPSGKGFTCLGFDVCLDRSRAYAEWLRTQGVPAVNLILSPERGTMKAYIWHQEMVESIRKLDRKGNDRCPCELTPQLIGLEGKRVEVVDCHGEKRRFIVGKSAGWIPCHLEIARRSSTGGCAVMGAPFRSVRIIG